ncbi:MAG TPA: CHASE3 domain-containing protein [Allosphingosinicella sp.]|jgi:signal transduction histidine kinase/CheY-like chemotaxis protein
MGESRPNRPLRALAAGFALLLLFVLATIFLSIRQQQASGWVAHTLGVENRLSGVLSLLQDAESGQRGYLLTRHEPFLDRYRESARRLAPELDALGRQISDNPAQLTALARLRPLAIGRQQDLSEVLNRFRATGRIDPDLTAGGKEMMDRIRLQIGGMREEEERLLQARAETLRRVSLLAFAGLILSAAGILLLGGFAFANSRRQLLAAIEARDALADANEQLRAESASRQQAEDQMRQLQKMEALGHLTGGIAHDFNNMLAVVVGSLDMAARRLGRGETERTAACIDNALEGAQRASQLTGRLLAFSRQQPLDPQPVDANKLVGGMSEMLRRTIGEQLKVETVLAGGLWRTHADPSQLENAILNLCVNARDAMPGGGRLTVETANASLDDSYAAGHAEVAPGQYVLISVTDTGIGMTPEVAGRAFDPFYTTKGVGQGTGLGLSQVFGFVKQSHGHVKIYSETGQGTSVKVYLPRYFGEGTAAGAGGVGAGAEASGDALPRARDDEIVLVVEDEERVRHVSVDALRELGYTVVQASDARQALAVLAIQPRVDLLFTDVVMPDMNGRQLADEVARQWPAVRVLFTTGYTRNAIVHNGMLDPGVAFLPKPFTIEQLALKVRQVLDKEK